MAAFLFAAVALFGFVVPVSADTILLSNMPSNDGSNAGVTTDTVRAVTFTTGSGTFQVSSVTMELWNYLSSGPDLPVLTLNVSNGSSPGAVVGSFDVPTSTDSGFQSVVFTPTMTITLDADTTYWLVIAGTSDSSNFSWMASDPAVIPTSMVGAIFGSQMVNFDSGDPVDWEIGSEAHSFEIQGTGEAPEPTTMALLLLAAVGAAGYFLRSSMGETPRALG